MDLDRLLTDIEDLVRQARASLADEHEAHLRADVARLQAVVADVAALVKGW